LLQAIATTGKGFYLNLRGADTIDVLYDRGLAPLPKRDYSAKLVKRLHEKFYWPLGLAVLLLVIEVLLPERARTTARGSIVAPAAARATVLLILLSLATTASASESTARKAYTSGRYDAAFAEFQSLAKRRTDDARLNYNAGVAAHQAGDYDAAAQHLQRATGAKETALQQQAFYNLGNTRYRQGEQAAGNPEQQIARWEEALKHFETAKQMQPQDADAAFNHEFVKKKLEDLKQQQQQQKQEQQSKSDQEQKKDDQNSGQQSQQQQQNQQQQQQSGSEKKDQQSEQQKQDGQSQQKDSEQQRQQEEQKKKEEQQKQQQQAQADNQAGKPEGEQQAGAQASAVPVTMTPQQAQQLLEAHRNEEQVLMFQPPPPTNAPARRLKDW
jgi:Ca-activated chloride channel family protein